MKRQNSTKLSSSSCRENITNSSSSETDLHARGIGCLSGIVHLVCKHQSRRKFLITSGKKPEKNMVSAKASSESSPAKSPEQRNAQNDVVPRTAPDEQPRPRLSCEATARSPTIPPEIRRSDKSTESFRSAVATPTPSLVARLMGLSGETTVVSSESAAEKRRKLLGALEKCDRDLKALKKFIDTVRSAELPRQGPDPTAGADGKNSGGSDQEQPSPVSVLDGLTQSPSLTRCMKRQPNGRLQHHQQAKTVKPAEVDGTDHSPVISLSERIKLNITESLPPSARRLSISSPPSSPDHRIDQCHGNPGEAFYEDIARLKMVIGRGMRESVEQVCGDVEWGVRREAGRIGLALQDHICRDLIEETVKELGLFCNYPSPVSPPFEVCKRRLWF